jgi:hypothetical protein
MDNPRQEMYLYTKEHGYKKAYADRVYHLTLIEKFSTHDKSFYNRFRIVLTRNGIKRIDEVVQDTDYSKE